MGKINTKLNARAATTIRTRDVFDIEFFIIPPAEPAKFCRL
jgi:hypothetical protein